MHLVATAVGEHILQRVFAVEVFAVLVEHGHMRIFSELDRPAFRDDLSHHRSQQRGLSRAVDAHDPPALAHGEQQFEPGKKRAVAMAKGEI